MALKLFGRIIFFLTISIASIRIMEAKNTTGPGINTLYVPVGKLHPRSDFAGILINLNVAAAIKRGKFALNLTNTFLDNHRARQKIDRDYSGKDRVIHFITIKRNKVQQNLNILEADLHSASEKYKIPEDPSNPSNVPSSRSKRGVNFDIQIDVHKCLKTIVQGVVSIFSSPRSLDKIQKSVDNLAFQTSRLESKLDNFTDNIDLILATMQKRMSYYINTAHLITSINSALDIADETIMELLNSITPLVQGQLTHNLLDPLQAQALIDKTQQMADRKNLQVVVDQPADVPKCSVTTFATNKTWYALLSLPLVYRSETMEAYKFINIPWFYNNMSGQWDLRPGIVASDDSGLYPAIKNVFIPQEDLEEVCERFNNNYLCHKRINHNPTCQVSLMHNRTEGCTLKLADHKVRYSFGPFNYLFFQFPTRTLVKCPHKKSFSNKYHGLVNMNDISKCKISTETFTLLPRSTATTTTSFTDKTTRITVLNNDWLKVTLQFDTKNTPKDEEPDPWKQIRIIPDDTDDIKLFGSHTILVHSIGMFFIVTILLLLLTICLMNFFDYIPEQFKPVYPKVESSTSLVAASDDPEIVASPET